MKTYKIRPLDNSPYARFDAINLLCSNSPSESDRYEKGRLVEEVYSVQTLPFYRRFFAGYVANDKLLGVGGIKTADYPGSLATPASWHLADFKRLENA